MGFTPLEMDGQEAARTMLSWGTYPSYHCLEAVHNAFPFERSDSPGSYRNAVDEWNRCPADRRHPGDRNPPAGAILLFDLYVRSLGYNAGHIMIAYGGGENAVSTDRPVYGRIGMTTISEIEDDWGGTYLGWTDRIGGHKVITAATSPLAADERRAGAGGARARVEATSASAKVDDGYLDPGEKASFDGFTYGESVDGNNVWFRGAKYGRWYWSGAFEGGANVNGLPLIGAAAPTAGYQRVVTGEGVYERSGPGTQYARTGADREWAAGAVLDFKGWARGATITLNGVTTDIWFQGRYSEKWFSAACFTSQSTSGLAEVTFTEPGTPAATDPQTPVDAEWKHRTPDSALARWVGSPNFGYRPPRPAGAAPTHVTAHWMAGTLEGTDAQFQKTDPGTSATYGIGQTEIHQYVRESDYQQADGSTESNRWGLSIEHEASPSAPASQGVRALSARLLADIAKRHGWAEYVVFTGDLDTFRKMSDADRLKYIQAFNAANPTKRLVFPHKAWVSTSCPGTLPFSDIVEAANKLLTPAAPVEPPATGDDQLVTVGWVKALFEAIAAAVRGFFGGQK